MIEQTKDLLIDQEILKGDIVFAIVFFINCLSITKVEGWKKHIHIIYSIAIYNNMLTEEGNCIKFEDFTNIISSGINFEDVKLLELVSAICSNYEDYSNKKHVLNLSNLAQLYLKKEWFAFFELEKKEKSRPNIDEKPYYLIQIHVLLVKASIESFIQTLERTVDIEDILEYYKGYLNRNGSKHLSVKEAVKTSNLLFIAALEELYKNVLRKFLFVNFKKENKVALQAWKNKYLNTSIIYNTWLIRICEELSLKLK